MRALSWLRGLVRGKKSYLLDMPAVEVFVNKPTSPIDTDERVQVARNEQAAALCDPDTFSYILLRVRATNRGASGGELVVGGYVDESVRDAVVEGLQRVEKAIRMSGEPEPTLARPPTDSGADHRKDHS